MKNYFYYTLILFVFFTSCGSKKTITKNSTSQKVNGALKDQLYYEADKARLQGDNETAKNKFIAYLQTYPDAANSASANFFLAKIYDDLNNTKLAFDCAEKATKLAPSNLYYKDLYAELLAVQGNEDKATEVFRQLSVEDKKTGIDYLYKAAFYLSKKGKTQQVIDIYNELENNFGENDEVKIKKIYLYKKLKQNEEALKQIDKLINNNPNEIKYYLLKAELYDAQKDKTKIEAVYTNLETKFANNAQLQAELCMHFIQMGDTAKYITYLQKSLDNKEIEPEQKIQLLLPFLAKVKKDSTKIPQLLQYAKQIKDASPNDSKAISIYASALQRSGKGKEAIEEYKNLIKKEPTNFENWQQLLFVETDLQNYDSLIATSKKAMTFFPKQALVYYMNGIGHHFKKDYDNAIKSFNKCIELGETNGAILAQTYAILGDEYNTKKQYALSDSCFTATLKLQPDDASTLNNFAYYLSERNERLAEAETMSKKSLEIRKDEKTFLDTYAWILYKQKKFADALAYEQKAIDAEGEIDATLLDHFGDILFTNKQIEKAVEYWQKAKAKGSENKWLDKKIKDKQLYE